MNSPLPFCQAVYQDRLRNDVKNTIAVATVPCLSLISFQRLPVQLPPVLLIQACISASGERTGGDGGPDHLLSAPRSSFGSRSLLESRGSPAELMHFQRKMCNPHARRYWKRPCTDTTITERHRNRHEIILFWFRFSVRSALTTTQLTR